MNSFKQFLRKQWIWISPILCLLAVFTWSSGGSLLGGLGTCVVTSFINYRLFKWLMPEQAATFFQREGFFSGLRYALPYLGAAALMLAVSVVRTPSVESITIDIGALLTFLILAVAEPFLICGPVLHLMMNRYAQDDVGVFQAVLYSGLAYGLAYFAYGLLYLTSVGNLEVFPVIAQGVYVSLMGMFLATLYLCTENFYLVLAARVIGLVLERGTEILSPGAVNIYTLYGLNTTDCIIILVIAVVLGLIAMNYSTNVPPWDKGDFKKRKKPASPLPLRNPRLDSHSDSRLPWKRKK